MDVKIVENREYRLKMLCAVSNCGDKRYIFTFDDDLNGLMGIYDFLKTAYNREKRKITIEFLDAPVCMNKLDSIFPEKFFLL